MARIPDSELERLKKEIAIERLVMGFGVELKRHGAELIGTCPFHEDKTPSLVISPKTNLWHCLGKCNVGGSTIDWVMKTKGISFRHAVELLKADHSSLAAGEGRVVRKGTAAKLDAPLKAEAGVAPGDGLLSRNVEGIAGSIAVSGIAGASARGDAGALSNRLCESHVGLSDKNRKEGAELRGRLQTLGILRESGHEHFMGSVVFPVLSLEGNVLGMYGRKITAGLRAGTPLHTYLPGPHRGVWNEVALTISPEIILCESIIDALTFWCAGFRNVTASYGVNGFTEDHKAAFARHGVKRVWIAYDRDEAGEKAARELSDQLMAQGVDCYRVLFPKGMDANEYALKVTPASKSLGLLLHQAQWLGKGQPPAKESVEIVAEETGSETVLSAQTPAAKEEINDPVFSLAAEPLLLKDAPSADALRTIVPAVEVPIEVKGEEIIVTLGDRRYRIRGLFKNLSYDLLKVNLLASRADGFHVDTLDLYAARQRAVFQKQAAIEMGVNEEAVKRDLGRVLLKLEEMQDEQIKNALKPKQEAVSMSGPEREAALELLQDPKLLDRILEDFARCGVVGEETNKLTGYIAAVSRHLDAPLAVMVQSSSAAGKSSLMEAILALLPEEHRVQYSAMTGQSLFYMGETDLKHKVLAIVEEEGVSRAAYALKLLQSEGVLTIASTGKDPATGRLVTHQYRVEGPVMIFLTTTAIDLDEELLNRCLVLTVNEDREQTQAIHRRQREAQTLEGLLARQEREEILKMHRNAQRLLKPLFVTNPYARELTFLDSLTRTRRDHTKYLTLIRSIALLHQYQRPVKTAMHRGQPVSYIEVTLADIETANRLAHEVLGRSLDELPPQTRRLLLLIEEMVAAQCGPLKMERTDFRFSRRDVRAHTGWGDTQLKLHLHRLEELEYLLVHHGGRGQSFVYELLLERQATGGKPMLPGLIDVANLHYDGKKPGPEGEKAGSSRGQAGGVSGGGRGAPEPMNTGLQSGFRPFSPNGTDTGRGDNPVVIVTAANV